MIFIILLDYKIVKNKNNYQIKLIIEDKQSIEFTIKQIY